MGGKKTKPIPPPPVIAQTAPVTKTNQFKVLIIGDQGVGRSKLAMAFDRGDVLAEDDQIYPTMRPFNKEIVEGDNKITIRFFDTSTEERCRKRALWLRDSNCVLICFSLNDPNSLSYITVLPPDEKVETSTICEDVQSCAPHSNVILVGTKSDLDRTVDDAKVQEVREKFHNSKYVECDDKNWEQIKVVFDMAVTGAKTGTAKSNN
eukprot:TRINITY_DN451_c0_g1_i1.p1 TRINITY_DN451_c0_g1~~TRINITY_DN451_c0_g1_i1.p1  ORF type:complete len:206 (-),score=21.47 TRINITY_DN451_c0_g1_i1:164-781(-)